MGRVRDRVAADAPTRGFAMLMHEVWGSQGSGFLSCLQTQMNLYTNEQRKRRYQPNVTFPSYKTRVMGLSKKQDCIIVAKPLDFHPKPCVLGTVPAF